MKPLELKSEFIKLRSQGKSYRTIASLLHINFTTCRAWGKELKAEIDQQKQAELEALFQQYGLVREARVKSLARTLSNIDTALEKADLTKIPPAKLLELRLKYFEALKSEYVSTDRGGDSSEITADQITASLAELLAQVQSGEVTGSQAKDETAIIANLLRAYELTIIKDRLDAIEGL